MNSECVPNLATPKPSPHPEIRLEISRHLDLTPEKKPNANRKVPNRKQSTVVNELEENPLAVPTVNSTARIQFQMEELRKKRSIRPKDPLNELTNPEVLKVVNVPFLSRQYKDLVSVDVATSSVLTSRVAFAKPSRTNDEEPDISDFFESEHILETAVWDFGHPSFNPQLLLPHSNSVYTLHHHMQTWNTSR